MTTKNNEIEKELMLIFGKSVKDRTNKEHFFAIKEGFGGSVRDYLLSMGEFIEETEKENEIEKCEECCYVRDMTNIRPPLCNYHQGFEKGKASKQKDILKIIEKTDFEKIQGISLGGKLNIIIRKELKKKIEQK